MTYMTATVRLEDGKIYGIYAHYEDVKQVLRERSVDCIRQVIEDAKARGHDIDYELVEGQPYLNYYDCVVVDFKKKQALEVDNNLFRLKKLLSDFEVHEIDLLEMLEGFVDTMFGGI